jgi:anthranilate phosphoribosyltransferase
MCAARVSPDPPPAAPPEFRPAAPGGSRLTPLLRQLLAGSPLRAGQSAEAFEAIMSGAAHHGEIGALLALLATRVPTAEEILGAARVMRRHVDRVPTALDPNCIVDTAGTGGAPKLFNVSTAAAIIAAAALRAPGSEAPRAGVAKHGNRSRTGRGSAEVLRELGVIVDADRAIQARCLDEIGLCFCFAIHHHPAAKHAMPVRQALGFPTIFNLLGPLTNPAGARRQLLGVYDPAFLSPIAEALAALGAMRAMVVHSMDGLDEISINAPTRVMHVDRARVWEETIDPRKLGIRPAPPEALTARDLPHAAEIVRGILEGREKGSLRDIAVLNAAATLLVAGAAPSLDAAVPLASTAIDRGAAAARLHALCSIGRSS